MTPDRSDAQLLWLTNVLDVVAQFASEEFQRAAWVEFNGPEGATYEEACELLDDSHLGENISGAPDDGALRPGERKVLAEFWRALEHYDERVYQKRIRKPGQSYADAELVISQPEWKEVRETAMEVLKYFKAAGFPAMPKLPIFDRGTVHVLKSYWEV